VLLLIPLVTNKVNRSININKILDSIKVEEKKKEVDLSYYTNKKKETKGNNGIIVPGVDKVAITFSQCCSPIPGDEIIGFISRTQGVSIHRKSCENVRKSLENPEEAGKWIKVSWQNGTKNRYSTDIKIESKTRIGGYVEILNIFYLRIPEG
jgi:GTP pyrophosphokinase